MEDEMGHVVTLKSAGTDDVLGVIAENFEAIASGDARRDVAVFADDFVAYELQPPLAFDAAEGRDPSGLEEWFATWRSLPCIALRQPHVEIAGNLAVVYGLTNMRGRKVDGAEIDLWYRSTFVLRWDGASWKIAHLHTSVPFRMDGSEKAALDLKP
jgi:ketosteroid isomerase-like protein